MVSKIDYGYIHDKSCELTKHLENVLNKDIPEFVHLDIRNYLQDIAFHEHERKI